MSVCMTSQGKTLAGASCWYRRAPTRQSPGTIILARSVSEAAPYGPNSRLVCRWISDHTSPKRERRHPYSPEIPRHRLKRRSPIRA